MNWLATLVALLKLVPSILESVTTVETIITAPKQGALKKAIVMAPLVALAPPEVQAAASAFIDTAIGNVKTGIAAATAVLVAAEPPVLAPAPVVIPASAEHAES
jgi:hypothetical protein